MCVEHGTLGCPLNKTVGKAARYCRGGEEDFNPAEQGTQGLCLLGY